MLGFVALPAYPTIVQTASGLSSVGSLVSFRAELTISGDILTVQLFNTSTVSTAPSELLSSYYFDIVSGTTRPTLTYVSAVGDVWLADKLSLDVLQTADANLKADNSRDNTWAFHTLDASADPMLGFGLGTVGNNDLGPNGFNGNVVGGMDYSIYAGDATTENLDNRLLVKGPVTFTFSGLTGFTEGNIKHLGAFGLGAKPDSMLVPEATTMIAGALLLLPFGASILRILRKSRRA